MRGAVLFFIGGCMGAGVGFFGALWQAVDALEEQERDYDAQCQRVTNQLVQARIRAAVAEDRAAVADQRVERIAAELRANSQPEPGS